MRKIKEITLKSVKQETISSLKMQRINAQARKESATRPKDIINKYRLLLVEANRDKSVLERLTDSKSELSLSIAKEEKPWELVSQPELYSMPLDRDYLKNSIISMVLFSISGIFVFMIREYILDIIYDTNKISKDSKYKKKILIESDVDDEIFSRIELFLSSITDQKEINIGIVNLSSNLNITNNIEKYFKKINYKNYTISQKVNGMFRSKYKIIIVKTNENTYKELEKATEELLINSAKIDSIIIHNSN